MSGRRIVGAMFICMAALFYLAKYVLFELHYSGMSFDEDVNNFQLLEEVLPGGTWISILFLIIGLAYLLWDDRVVFQKTFILSDKQVEEELKKTDLK
ncbi:hypothetical protein [Bacillus pumilus]|uniref:Uncharacterized protein n=1 Tax=Bacillus pumilus (strain SAFR-032) TaxID=315750 RepID=A8FB52_BACP2|nr:hypothetical protein [Bacillus pumilus]ABV61469.1 hypothetical protein BPUM_0785 [Bacillus pumilus SAFR-032]MBC3643434.1 hypothetical protein [Bacillus pumilus]MBC3646110.1 hypothetical protein [Bacillus pumilus]MBC3650637.1 hypothetical protein [Bacillus pumilus]MBC3654107.1 hypothetical protein [Bacillus pumilus]